MAQRRIEQLLTDLDDLLGSRDETCEVLAIASATVLTASPVGAERDFLDELDKNIPKAPSLSGIMVSARFRRTSANKGPDAERYRVALRQLLDRLEDEHCGAVADMLGQLRLLASSALAATSPERRQKWSEMLCSAHKRIQCGYLENHPELN